MKAITIWQPWATLIVLGLKRFETRGWSTNYRGTIAIHAGSDPGGLSFALRPAVAAKLYEAGIRRIEDLPRGAVLGIATLEECFTTGWKRPSVGDFERRVGDWREGRFAWELRMVEVFDEPIRARGAQGLWTWNRESVTQA